MIEWLIEHPEVLEEEITEKTQELIVGYHNHEIA